MTKMTSSPIFHIVWIFKQGYSCVLKYSVEKFKKILILERWIFVKSRGNNKFNLFEHLEISLEILLKNESVNWLIGWKFSLNNVVSFLYSFSVHLIFQMQLNDSMSNEYCLLVHLLPIYDMLMIYLFSSFRFL